ncbi:collagenase-like [Bradysia coprophila]|uniref:collagenase-like n=1 Tax=Bradysia coprophila TaxID=38358 RepID=UPI00187D883C|nr:collagenase-like [Bradysia coprophila]
MNKFIVLLIAAVISVDAATYSIEGIAPRIINGQLAATNQFPWHVSIQGNLTNGQAMLCGGALISNAFVLTAAHCVVNVTSPRIGMGSNVLAQPQISMVAQSRIIHPNYNSQTYANDLALLRLPLNLTSSASIQWIRLPSLSQATNQFVNASGILSGFGRINDQSAPSANLRYARTRVMTNANCQLYYGSAAVTNSTLCTLGYDINAQGPCANDNGGPLHIVESNGNTLIGIHSFFSSSGCNAGHPAGYARISSYTQWISQQAGIATRP